MKTILRLMFIAFLIVTGLSSCYTHKTAFKRIAKADARHPATVQKFLNKRYPLKLSPPVVKYIKGDTVEGPERILHDTTDNLITKTIIKTRYVHDTVKVETEVESTLALAAANSKLDEFEEASRAKDELLLRQDKKIDAKNKKILWLSITLGCLIALIIISFILKRYLGGWIGGIKSLISK